MYFRRPFDREWIAPRPEPGRDGKMALGFRLPGAQLHPRMNSKEEVSKKLNSPCRVMMIPGTSSFARHIDSQDGGMHRLGLCWLSYRTNFTQSGLQHDCS